MPAPAKINKFPEQGPRVLVAPLDWGLGHATRCIPIIKELLIQKCQVVVATSGVQKALLQAEFPSISFVELSGYGVKYDKNRALTILRLVRSIPKILICIKREKAWLGQLAGQEGLDLVISDNRYGLAMPGVCCVFMTHQLLIKTPFGGWVDRLLQRMNYRLIRRFSRCWVPDEAGSGLAGELSHPRRMPPVTTRYIGVLSRFSGFTGAVGAGFSGAGDAGPAGDYVLALLSGPEPQRTLFEKDLLRQAMALADVSFRLVVVRGLPGGGAPAPAGDLPDWVRVYDHLPALSLGPLIRGARLIVARPGYSTIMDLETLGKRALLVPTPGQTEQEYLGAFLASKGWGVCVKQKDFSLREALEPGKIDERVKVSVSTGLLSDEVRSILSLL